MAKRVVILGGGTGGTLVANRLRKEHRVDDVAITVVDLDDRHLYQPGLSFVPFGLCEPDEVVRPRSRQIHRGVETVRSSIEQVDLDARTVELANGDRLSYDVLVVATGASLAPEETDGLTGPGWNERVFTFYSLEGATLLGRALDAFGGGRLVVNVMDMPIKCPVAPLEFAFLADWYFHERKIRDRVHITYVTPLDAAFTKPAAASQPSGLLEEKDIELVTDFNTGSVDGAGGRLIAYDGREVGFDLAAVIPLHTGAPWVGRSEGLGDALDFVPTDRATLQSLARPEVFAIGDATDLPASKAGSATHFEGEVLVANIGHFLAGEPLDARYDGHTNCFIETGFSKAMLIDFNYETEPLPGRYPSSLGLPLLKPTHLNHLGKLAFQWFYWHALLPGRDVPGIHSDMPHAGKPLSTTRSDP